MQALVCNIVCMTRVYVCRHVCNIIGHACKHVCNIISHDSLPNELEYAVHIVRDLQVPEVHGVVQPGFACEHASQRWQVVVHVTGSDHSRACLDLPLFWSAIVLACLCFGLPMSWSAIVLICHCLGLRLFWSAVVLVCHCFGLPLSWPDIESQGPKRLQGRAT